MNKDFNFLFSISVGHYDRNTDSAKNLEWIETNANINALAEYIKNGFAFCNCFHHNSITFKNTEKTDKNIKSCNMIVFDFDAVKLSFDEFINMMAQTELTPSMVYTTQNDGKFKPNKNETYCNRYRVIYVTDSPILNNTLYKEIHHHLKREIELITNDSNVFNDNSDCSISHFFGGNKNAKIYLSSEIYALSFFLERYSVSTLNYIVKEDTQSNNNNVTYISLNNEEGDTQSNNNIQGTENKNIIKQCNQEFLKDFYTLPILEFLQKYYNIYRPIDKTPLQDNGKMIIDVDENYTEIRRKYNISRDEKDGKTYFIMKVQRLRDGEQRRKHLYINLLLRKRIVPQISLEHLIYCGLWELFYYIDNKEDTITKKEILIIALNAYKSKVTIIDKKRKKYKINKEFCYQNNINPRKANILYLNNRRMQEKQNRDSIIKQLYNESLSDVINNKILKDNGIDISIKTLRRWKKENGL